MRHPPGTFYAYHVGVDLGQSVDSTAIAVLEHERHNSVHENPAADPKVTVTSTHTYRLRHLERLPLGTPYPAQAQNVAQLLNRAPLSTHETSLILDQTGVGRPVVDLFRGAGLRPVAVTITAGSEETNDGDDWRVPKLTLISRLQAMLHSGELKIAQDLPESRALVQELQDFRVSHTATGYAQLGAREGRHDDLVLALALAGWSAAKPKSTVTSQRVRGLM